MWKFIKSAPNKKNYLIHNGLEICFLGRSNVGKSTLINSLANNKIARTSSTPGRTQLVNYFEVNEKLILVDLPGYGYANLSNKQKEDIILLLEEYLLKSKCSYFFLLFDFSVGFLKNDFLMYDFLISQNKNIILVGTKEDKANQSIKHKNLLWLKEQNKPFFIVSKQNKKSLSNLKNYINNLI